MPRKKPPTVAFDYRAWAHGTSTMPPEERGDYITIMCAIWDTDDWAVPFDLEFLRGILHCFRHSDADKRVRRLIERGKLFLGPDGRIHNRRADTDYNGFSATSGRDHAESTPRSAANDAEISSDFDVKSANRSTSSVGAGSQRAGALARAEEIHLQGFNQLDRQQDSSLAQKAQRTDPELFELVSTGPSPATTDRKLQREFDFSFWPAYPEKRSKANAKRAWLKARRKASLDEIMAGLRLYIDSKPPDRQWQYPATWLNGEGWLDEPAPPVVATKPRVQAQATGPPAADGSAKFREFLRKKAQGE
jgi:hypothetical protein